MKYQSIHLILPATFPSQGCKRCAKWMHSVNIYSEVLKLLVIVWPFLKNGWVFLPDLPPLREIIFLRSWTSAGSLQWSGWPQLNWLQQLSVLSVRMVTGIWRKWLVVCRQKDSSGCPELQTNKGGEAIKPVDSTFDCFYRQINKMINDGK